VNSLSDYYLNIDEMDASVLGAELRFDFKLHKNNRMFLGFEFMHTWLTIANYDKEPSGSALKNCLGRDEPCVDINKAYTSFSVFGLDEIRLLSNLIFTIRLRYDNYGDAYDDFQSITLPSLSMVWLMTDSSALKFSYSEACRAPSIYEANYDDSGISMSKNPKLRPEKIKSYEAVYQHKLTEDFSAKIGFFYYDISGLIDQDRFFSEEGEIIQYRNMGDITMEGVEFETGGFITDFIHGSFSWTFQQAKDSEGKSLPNSPAENGKLRFSMPLYMDRIFSGIEFLYLGARKTAAGRDLDPYLLANLTFSIQNIYRTLSISASIYNLFDVRYYDAVSLDQYPIDSILQDGISFRLKASYTF
jgi:iron complex outermembrane receptor protein